MSHAGCGRPHRYMSPEDPSRAGRLSAMDLLTLFGIISVASMLLCYALEERSPAYVLGFAAACWSSALYGWLAGTWPFAVVESVWGIVALRRFVRRFRRPR